MVAVASFDDPSDAEVLKVFLRKEGLEAEIQDERRLQRFWFMTGKRAGVHILVPGPQLELSKQALERWEQSGGKYHRPVHCPACNSARVQFPHMTRRFILPTLLAQAARVLGFIEPAFYCEDCHHTWTESEARGRRRRGRSTARKLSPQHH